MRTSGAILATLVATLAIAQPPSPSPPVPSPPVSPPPVSPAAAGPRLAALAPSPDDARKAVAIGPFGEVYEPDGKGAWVRGARVTTGDAIAHVGRSGGSVVAFADGVVYRLAPNGWSAFRLHQKDRAVMSAGDGAIAAVGRQLFALDRTAAGEPMKLAIAPAAVVAMGSSATGAVIQTERGLFRVEVKATGGAKVVAVKHAPPVRRVVRLVGDRWALLEDGAIDLRTGRKTGWPPGVTIAAAAAGPEQQLVLAAAARGKLELVTLRQDKLDRAPVDAPPIAAASIGAGDVAGLATDKAGRVVIALRDGQLLVRERAGAAWTATRVTEQLPGPKPGARAATSR